MKRSTEVQMKKNSNLSLISAIFTPLAIRKQWLPCKILGNKTVKNVRSNRSTKNRDMVDNAKRDVVSELVTLSNYREAEFLNSTIQRVQLSFEDRLYMHQ